MTEQYQPIAELLDRVRTRWRRLSVLQATTRAALAAGASLALLLIISLWLTHSSAALVVIGVIAIATTAAAVLWAFLPLRRSPSDARIARFVEERNTALDERLVSAVGVTTVQADSRPALADSMVRDAARRAAAIDPADIIGSDVLRRAMLRATAAVVVLLGVAFLGREKARQSFDAASLTFFPSQLILEVSPGDARIPIGSNVLVKARLLGNRAPVIAQLLRADGGEEDAWRSEDMAADAAGGFALALNSLTNSFRYRVVAGAVTSETFTVAVVRAPRVKRIDVEYTYSPSLGLERRLEQDGGDIYAPAGTDVRVFVHTDAPAASGQMTLGNGKSIELAASADGLLHGALQVVEDGSYRVALADAQGLSSRGDTEYFIRTLEDRPPEVHVVKPASDRRVTKLEEVGIEAEATDDFGVAALDLVYSVRGGPNKVVPLSIPVRSTAVSGRHTLYLEDLDVAPGDFVSYYVRARDLARGKRSSETRSDIFFLEVKPFEEEFTLAQTQAAMGGGQANRQIDDLVAAQKQIIVATWKLDRRSQAARGAQSAEDIRAVARAEGELKTRVEQESSTFRQSTMRDPRGRPGAGRGGPGLPPPPQPRLRAGQTLAEEDAMSAAAAAMGEAVTSLEALKTAEAVPPEMEALNQLLRAQADVKRRQVQQQAGGGGGGNRSSQDMSSLFDKELARHQQTNYETPRNATDENKNSDSAIDKIRDLARRQDELLQRQQNLTHDRDRLTPEELKRQLELLTREQNELRQRAEELAQQMARQQNQSGQSAQQGQTGQQQSGQQSGQGSQGTQSGQQQGQPNQAGQNGQPGQSGQPRPQGAQAGQAGQSGQAGQTGQSGNDMRAVSEEMRNATNDLRREDAGQASERAARALERLRELERQLEASSSDGRRRALGDLQLEARNLADAQRQIASESGRARQGPASEASKDALRRLAGEQDRLADRLGRVQQTLKQQAGSGTSAAGSKDAAETRSLQQSAANAVRELERERLAERMQQSAEAMRGGAGESSSTGKPAGAPDPSSPAQEDIARALDRLAEALAAADSGGDGESRKISGQLAKAQELRERLDQLTRQLSQLDQQAAQPGSQPGGRTGQAQTGTPSSPSAPGTSGRSGQGQGGSGGSAGEIARLREEATREMQQIRELMDQLRREDSTFGHGGAGFTFEGQGMTLSAPGTEAFKQDFARWQELKRQATAALEQVESTLTKKLQDKNAKDRLATGADDKAPAEYQQQVDSYFKALATKKKP